MRILRKRQSTRLADLALGKLPPQEALRLFEEGEHDPRILEDLDLHIALADFAASEEGNVFEERRGRGHLGERQGVRDFLRDRARAVRPVLVPVLVMVLVVVFSSLIWRGIQTDPYHLLVSVSDSEAEFRTRNLVGQELAPAAALYSQNRFEEGILILERYLREDPGGGLSAHVRYAAALGYLVEARSALFGFFPRYDTSLVRRGLIHLTVVLSDPSVSGLRDEALLYRAKASLMLGETDGALEDLETLISANGTLSNAARSLHEEVTAVQRRTLR